MRVRVKYDETVEKVAIIEVDDAEWHEWLAESAEAANKPVDSLDTGQEAVDFLEAQREPWHNRLPAPLEGEVIERTISSGEVVA